MALPVLYLYNLDNARGAKLRRMCLTLGIRTQPVPPQAHGLTLEELTAGASAPADGRAGFSDEMLLMQGFSSGQIDALLHLFRRAKLAPVALKAVLTPTNRGWTSVQLHRELVKERQAMLEGRAGIHG